MTTAATRTVSTSGSDPFDGHHGRVRTVAFAAGTDELISGGEDGTVRLWDLARGVELRSSVAHPGGVTAAVVVGDGSRLATTGADRRVRLWDRTTGETQPLRGPERVDALAGTPGSDRLAVAATGSVRVIDVATGDQLGAFAAPGTVRTMAMSADGATLAWTGQDGTVVVWDLGTGTSTRVTAHPGGVSALALCPTGDWLVTGDADGTVRLWDLDTRTEAQSLGTHPTAVRAVAISDDRRLIVSGADDGVIRAAEPGTGLWDAVGAHPGGVCALAVAPGAGLVASGGGDRTVRLWGPESAHRPTLAGHVGGVRTLAVSRDGRRLISGGEDRRLRVWDLATGAAPGRPLAGPLGAVRAVGSRADDVTVIAAGDDGVLWTWDPVTGRVGSAATGRPGASDRPGGPGAVPAAAVAPDGRRVVTGGTDGGLTVWDARTGARTAVLRGHRGAVDHVVVSHDSRAVVTAGSDRTVRVWDLATGAERRNVTLGTAVRALAVAPDDAAVLVGGDDGWILRWPVTLTTRSSATAQTTTAPEADRPVPVADHGAAVSALTVTPDGDRFVSGGEDGSIRLWDRRRPVGPLVLRGHTGPVRALAVTPDGAHVISGGDDGSIRVWDRARGIPVAGTGLDRAPVPAAPARGLVGDAVSPRDRLGREDDVDALAALVADRGTEPPLAVAVLGSPGSGTSSFLRQLHDRIGHLAAVSRANPGRSPAVASVRQVWLDAGLLTGDTAWISLVDHLAEHLADTGTPPGGEGPVAPPERDDLAAVRDRLDRLERGLTAHRRHRPVRGALSLVAALARPDVTDRRRLRGSAPAAAVVAAGALVLAATGRFTARDAGLAVLVAVLVCVLPLLGGAARRLRALPRGSRTLRNRAEQHRVDLHVELHAGQDRLDRGDAAGRLAALAEEARQGRPPAVGGVRRAHDDLRRLSDDLAAARAAWRQAGSPGPPPLERVIVHVDGLDRCPARTALDLLAALHWLLPLPLFAVVAAVDPAWLARSVGSGPDELDRLFPITFALRPMGAGADRLVDALLSPAGQDHGGATGSAIAADPDRTVMLDPQPDRLLLREPERELLRRLCALLDTPRAVKRYVNLYRLVRLSVPDSGLAGFVGPDGTGPYQAVLVLLALTVASPEAARMAIVALGQRDAGDHGDIWALLDDLARPDGCGRGEPPAADLRRAVDLLTDIRHDLELDGGLGPYRHWAGTVARFSVGTCDLVQPAEPPQPV